MYLSKEDEERLAKIRKTLPQLCEKYNATITFEQEREQRAMIAEREKGGGV